MGTNGDIVSNAEGVDEDVRTSLRTLSALMLFLLFNPGLCQPWAGFSQRLRRSN